MIWKALIQAVIKKYFIQEYSIKLSLINMILQVNIDFMPNTNEWMKQCEQECKKIVENFV